MNNRELDALVAEKVMGWDRGVADIALWYKNEQALYSYTPSFTSDPSDDYLVLKHVRENWNVVQQYKFLEELAWEWLQSFPDSGVAETVLSYEPGDYSKAALKTLGVEI